MPAVILFGRERSGLYTTTKGKEYRQRTTGDLLLPDTRISKTFIGVNYIW